MKKSFYLFFILLFGIQSTILGTNYYVSKSGNNSNSGTSVSSAFATIQHAVDIMIGGDTCYILGGTYHEAVDLSGLAGTEANPITITNYNHEKVILNGSVDVTSSWILESRESISIPLDNNTHRDKIPGVGNVYVTTLPKTIGHITQVFVEDKIMTLARWPNALAYEDNVFFRGLTQSLKTSSTHGEGTDSGTPFSLAETNVSVVGCVGMFGSVRLITAHNAGASDFSHNKPIRLESGSNYYFIEGGLNNAERMLLDSEQEWAYDESTRKLTLWPEKNQNPNNLKISVRNIMDAFSGNASTKYITIDGLDFFASKFNFRNSDNITIQNCNLTYFTASERALGVENNAKMADFTGNPSDFCENIKVYNCAFRYSDGTAFNANYVDGLTFENNLIYKAGYYLANEFDSNNERRNTHAFHAYQSEGIQYRRNTVNISGTSQTVAFYRYKPTEEPKKPIVAEYNFNTKCAGLYTDVSSMYIPEESVWESVTRFNWFIDNNRRDFRWDGANINEVKTARGNFYRNIGVQGTNPNKHAYKLKGDHHEIYNNIAIGNNWAFDVAEGKGGNANTISRNNAADLWSTMLFDDGFDWDIPGDDDYNYKPSSNGYIKSMHELLRDIDNRDFRPRDDANELIDQGIPVVCTINGVQVDVTAGYVDSAPDVGVYEHGDATYWIPGRQETEASMPVPKDGAINVPLNADLMYLIGLNGVNARVYIGKDSDNMTMVKELTDPFNIVYSDHDFTLDIETTYYWRVDTEVDNTWITGNIWSFTTRSNCATFSQIEAESFDDMYGVKSGTISDENEQYIGNIQNGDWVMYGNVDLRCANSIKLNVASRLVTNSIEVRLGSVTGTLIGTIPVQITGGWETWETVTGKIDSVNGVYDVYFVFKGEDGKGLVNLNWFEFSNEDSSLSLAENDLNSNSELKISPIPFKDYFTIKLSNKKEGTYTIYNFMGKNVGSGFLNNGYAHVVVDGLSSGLYLVKITSENTRFIKRIIKE